MDEEGVRGGEGGGDDEEEEELQYDPEHARMEAWLDEHPEFARDYFIRKAPRDLVDSWLAAHYSSPNQSSLLPGNVLSLAAATGSIATGISLVSPRTPSPSPAPDSGTGTQPQLQTSSGGLGPTGTGSCGGGAGQGTNSSSSSSCLQGSKPAGGAGTSSSGTTTPVRKISAQEFERGGLIKPMVTTIDGNPTFLSPSSCDQTQSLLSSSTSSSSLTNRKTREQLRALDERELLFELAKDICDELDTRILAYKILQHVGVLTSADRASLFLVQGKKGSGNRCLVSSLFDVCSQSSLEDIEKKEEIRIPWGNGIVGYVAESGMTVNIPDAYEDERFNQEIDQKTGYKTKSLLCMPIKDKNGDCQGVAQVINKRDGPIFTKKDETVFANYLQFCGIGLRNAQLYEQSKLENKRNQVLLDLARVIFVEQSTIEHVVYRILTHTLSIMQCQRGQVLLVHEQSKGTFSRVFDLEAGDINVEPGSEEEVLMVPFENRFPINVGITGYVATTGETVNIPDVYEDYRFDPSVDKDTDFRHNCIICMAIKNSSGQIIGVIQLINKIDSLPFSTSDEMFLEAFAIFCGMGINNTRMYEKAIMAMAKQAVTLDVLSYHATAPLEEAATLRDSVIPSSHHYHLHSFDFDDEHMSDEDTFRATLRMFLDLDLVKRFNIDYTVLCRWLLSVKKNYRKVIYHNWRHAFNVGQMMFAVVTATKWWKILGDMECLGLLIACLCHDMDHRGTNNSFQIKASSPLAQLYSTSTMERHHFDQSLMILSSKGNQILSQLSPDEYSRVISIIEDAILATDLAIYFKNRTAFMDLIETSSYNWNQEEHRSLLRGMLMTACDLAAITKPWEIEKRIAELVASEFFEQGDMEKEAFKITPIDMMNREKKDELPSMQVAFIDTICEPVYTSFARLSSELQPLLDGTLTNREHWIKLANKEDEKEKKMQGQS